MIEFIIEEENEELIKQYQRIILSLFGYREEAFKTHKYKNYILHGCNNKIYILANPNNNIHIAETIRKNGDWHSQIIIIGNKYIDHNKLLVLDWIEKNENTQENLKSALDIACHIISTKETLNFMLNSEVYKIPFKDILYIEKSNNQNHCRLYTNNKHYIINDTIKNLEDKLGNCCFMKTHRSCIVNLNNITSYNLSTNIIKFEKSQTDLVARDRKKLLKEQLITDKIKK